MLPALYMVWDPARAPAAAPISSSYDVASVPNAHVDGIRTVVELDGALTAAQWNNFVEQILPDGMFVARLTQTSDIVGTVSAIHNPRGARFYFPDGGAIAYLVVSPSHRGHGLGLALVTSAVARLRAAGYRTIWLGVEDSRHPAIRTYLRAGFVPFLHGPAPDVLEARWRTIFSHLERAPEQNGWCRELPDSRAD